MRVRIRQAATFLTVLFAASPVWAQPARTGRLNPPHLNEMPLVERVLRDITADNPKDAAARRMGAFEQLNEIIQELSNGRTAIGRSTPDEDRIMQEYGNARLEVQQPHLGTRDEEDVLRALRRFDEDPALRDELVNRFFSPALRAQSVAISRELMARRVAFRRQQAAFGGQAAPAAAASAVAPVRPAAPPPAKPLPPDPSILKARAANVDTRVFGLQLGDSVSLPVCGLMEMIAPSANCQVNSDVSGLANALLQALSSPGEVPELVTIKLARNSCPAWMSNCLVFGSLDKNGRLVAVFTQPDGPGVQQAAAKELRAKYGTRFAAQQRFVNPTNGSAQFEVWDLTWHLPGLHVEYRVVHDTITQGLLRIETDGPYERRMAAEREINRPKL